MNDIWVFEMSSSGKNILPVSGMRFLQKIGAPGLVNHEAMIYQEGFLKEPEVMLITATNIQLDFSPDSAILSTFIFDTANNVYKAALLRDSVQVLVQLFFLLSNLHLLGY